jgi:ParB-like chromosome segregation protein Spo0J
MRNRAAAARRNGRLKTRSRGEIGLVRIQPIPIENLRSSPENDALYSPVDPADPEIVEMSRSIAVHGVQEPLIVTADLYVVSGHRRLVAAKLAGLIAVPCKVLDFDKDEDHDRFMHLLRECNRQRVKTFNEKLREEAISANPDAAYQSLIEHRKERSQLDLETLDIRGEKRRSEISKAKLPLLEAINGIIEDRRQYWPLSDRQIHYALLNDPPLIHASKPGSRYRNDLKSYKALTELLTRARIADEISMSVIQDATRPVTLWDVHRDVQGYLRTQLEEFGKE